MSVAYPQAAVVLRVIWEDFGTEAPALQNTYTLEILPKRISVRLNNYREADEFDIEMDYRTFPFDPRLIRSCQVSIHVENMKSLVDENGATRKIKPLAPDTGPDHNTVLTGFVDTIEIEHDDDSKMVKMRGRDFTSLYVDTPWTLKTVSYAQPVDKVIADIIKGLPTTGDIQVENRTGKAELPTLSKVAPDLGELSGKRNSQKKENYWEVIQEIAAKSALIIFIELDKLVITDPTVLTEPAKAVNFIYGHNIKNISFERKVGRMKGFNVRVRAIIGKEVKVIDIPRQAKTLDIKGRDIMVAKQTSKGTKVQDEKAETAPFMSFAVTDIVDEAALIAQGEKIFIEMSRQQIEGKFTTYEMTSFDGDKKVIDLTKIRNGAAVSIEINPQDMKEMQRASTPEERMKYLVARNYAPQAAAAIAENFGRFSTPFYVRDVEMSFESERGWKLEVSFINRIEVSK